MMMTKKRDATNIYPMIPLRSFGALACGSTVMGKLIKDVYAGDVTAFYKDMGISRSAIYRWIRQQQPGANTIKTVITKLGLECKDWRILYVSEGLVQDFTSGRVGVESDIYKSAAAAESYARVEGSVRAFRDSRHPTQKDELDALLGYVRPRAKGVKGSDNNYMLNFDEEGARPEPATIKDRLSVTISRALAQAVQAEMSSMEKSTTRYVDERILMLENRMSQQLDDMRQKLLSQEDVIMRLLGWVTANAPEHVSLALLDSLVTEVKAP